MIGNLTAKRFRAFESFEIDFSKINVFLGPNNSGKTSALSGLTLLAQTARIYDEKVALQLNGDYENLGTFNTPGANRA